MRGPRNPTRRPPGPPASMAMMARFGGGGRGAGGCTSGGGDDDGAEVAAVATAPSVPAAGTPRPRCCRCDDNTAVAHSRGEWLCAFCLASGVAGRARRALGGCAAVGHPLAIGLNGSAGSLCVMDAVARMLDCGRRRRPFPAALAVIVDTVDVVGDGGEEHSAAVEALVATALMRGLPALVVPLAAAFAGAGPVAEPTTADATAVAAAPSRAATSSWEELCVLVPAPPVATATAAVTSPVMQHLLFRPEDAAVVAAVGAFRERRHRLRTSEAWAASWEAAVAAIRAAASLDARQELLDACVRSVAVAAAAAHGCAHLAWCGCADTLAIRGLYDTCTGRGYAAPAHADASFALPVTVPRSSGAVTPLPFAWYPALPARDGDSSSIARTGVDVPSTCTLVQPLMEVEARELALWAWYAGATRLLPALTPLRDFVTAAGPRDCMHAAVRGLVTSLQATYGNTVHNVGRTLRKAPHPLAWALVTHAASPAACIVCGDPLPDPGSSLAAMGAALARLEGLATDAEAHTVREGAAPPLVSFFCHGCLLAARESEPASPSLHHRVATWVGAGAAPTAALHALASHLRVEGSRRAHTREELRDLVADCLLDSDDEEGEAAAAGGGGEPAAAIR